LNKIQNGNYLLRKIQFFNERSILFPPDPSLGRRLDLTHTPLRSVINVNLKPPPIFYNEDTSKSVKIRAKCLIWNRIPYFGAFSLRVLATLYSGLWPFRKQNPTRFSNRLGFFHYF